MKEYYLVMQHGSQDYVSINKSYSDTFSFNKSLSIDDKLLLIVYPDNKYEIIYYEGDNKEVIKEVTRNKPSNLVNMIIKRFKEICELNKNFAFYEYEVTIDTENKYHHNLISYVNKGV